MSSWYTFIIYIHGTFEEYPSTGIRTVAMKTGERNRYLWYSRNWYNVFLNHKPSRMSLLNRLTARDGATFQVPTVPHDIIQYNRTYLVQTTSWHIRIRAIVAKVMQATTTWNKQIIHIMWQTEQQITCFETVSAGLTDTTLGYETLIYVETVTYDLCDVSPCNRQNSWMKRKVHLTSTNS